MDMTRNIRQMELVAWVFSFSVIALAVELFWAFETHLI